MKTMQKAIDRFNSQHRPYNTAILDTVESYKGFYRVVICDDWGWIEHHIFHTVKEFTDWADGVVFENEL